MFDDDRSVHPDVQRLAIDVDALILSHDAQALFRDQLRAWAKAEAAHDQAYRRWNQRYHAALQAILTKPQLQDEDAGPPRKGMRWVTRPLPPAETVPTLREDGTFPPCLRRRARTISGWWPASVPDRPPPRPSIVEPPEALPIEYKFARVAAIHDYCVRGAEQIGLPEWAAFWSSLRDDEEEESDPRNLDPTATAAIAYAVMVADTPKLLSGGTRPELEWGILRGFYNVVEAEVKKWAAARDKQAEKRSPDEQEAPADKGEPFWKPSSFSNQWNIGSELLRKNATDSAQYTVGRVRRRKIKPSNPTKKPPAKSKRAGGLARSRPVYWYSEPDARKRWPDRFAEAASKPPKT